MSKSSQHKRSMYELGKLEATRYQNPSYPKSKEYMRGWNESYTEGCWITLRSPLPLITLPRILIFTFALTVTIYVGSLLI